MVAAGVATLLQSSPSAPAQLIGIGGTVQVVRVLVACVDVTFTGGAKRETRRVVLHDVVSMWDDNTMVFGRDDMITSPFGDQCASILARYKCANGVRIGTAGASNVKIDSGANLVCVGKDVARRIVDARRTRVTPPATLSQWRGITLSGSAQAASIVRGDVTLTDCFGKEQTLREVQVVVVEGLPDDTMLLGRSVWSQFLQRVKGPTAALSRQGKRLRSSATTTIPASISIHVATVNAGSARQKLADSLGVTVAEVYPKDIRMFKVNDDYECRVYCSPYHFEIDIPDMSLSCK